MSDVQINGDHAFSLIEMVKWFRELVDEADMPSGDSRSDKLTAEYCDELIEALTNGD